MQTFAATLVYRNNPDICQDPTDAEAGNPHEVVWKKVTEGRVEAINTVKLGQSFNNLLDLYRGVWNHEQNVLLRFKEIFLVNWQIVRSDKYCSKTLSSM